MDGIDDIIGNAAIESGIVESNDQGELVATEDETPIGEETPETSPEETSEGTTQTEETPPEEAATSSEDDLDRELMSLGILPKDTHGRETRMRYSRIKKMWANKKAALDSEFKSQREKADTDWKRQVADREARLADFEQANRLIASNPMFYLQSLIAVRPEYRDHILAFAKQQGGTTAAAASAIQQTDDPRPQPDGVFPDGTKGYTPEGLQKLEEWNRRQTIRDVEERMAQKYGKPIETFQTERRANQERNLAARRVQENVSRARQVYGQAFIDDFGELGNIKADSQVMKVLNEHRDAQGRVTITFMDACAMALIPKFQADRNKMREEITEELKRAPAAARRSAPGAAVASKPAKSDTVEGLIAEEARRVGMI